MTDRLELAEDRDFQRRFWRIGRIAWAVFALMILAALAGLTGSGGLWAEKEVRTTTALLRYPAVGRWQTENLMAIEVEGDGQLLVELDRRFIELYTLARFVPAPLSETPTAYGLALTYEAGAESLVHLHVKPRRPSIGAPVTIRINGEPIRLTPTILP